MAISRSSGYSVFRKGDKGVPNIREEKKMGAGGRNASGGKLVRVRRKRA